MIMMPWEVIFYMLGLNLTSILSDLEVISTDSNSEWVGGKVTDHTLNNWLCGDTTPTLSKTFIFISDFITALNNHNAYIDPNLETILKDAFSGRKSWEVENLPTLYNSRGEVVLPYTQNVIGKLRRTSNEFVKDLYDSDSDKISETNLDGRVKNQAANL